MTSIFRNAIVAACCLAFVPVATQAKSKASKDEAQVQCKDGTTSKPGRGACSHHGGVAAASAVEEKVDKAEAAAKRTGSEAAQGAEVQCKDGTTSKAGRGACSHHGGVASVAPREEAGRSGRGNEQDRRPSESQAAPQGRAPATTPQRAPPAGQPTARCKDGTLSYSQHRSGTCSRHGGVAQWLGQ